MTLRPRNQARDPNAAGAQRTVPLHLHTVPSAADSDIPQCRFSLIVATVGRLHELAAFLEALTAQTYRHFEVIVVDQNTDERLAPLLARYADYLAIVHVHSAIGLSRARNVGLSYATGDIIAFPDDDCTYPPTLLSQVVQALAPGAPFEGIAILPRSVEGEPFPRLHRRAGPLTADNVFRRCVSIGLFLRADLVRRTGLFNEALGLGSGTQWASAEDVDYPLRALLAGCRMDYRPDITVTHPFGVRGNPRELARLGRDLGGGVGYVLRRHRFPFLATIELLIVRPTGGLIMGVLRGSASEVCFYAGTLYGKIRGWLSA